MTDSKGVVIYLDDEHGATMVMGIVLKRAGYEYHAANDVGELAELVAAHKPDLIMTDDDLQYGGQGLKEVVVPYAEAGHKVLVLSGHSDPRGYEAAVLAEGGVGLLTKPAQNKDVIEAIAKAIEAPDVATAQTVRQAHTSVAEAIAYHRSLGQSGGA